MYFAILLRNFNIWNFSRMQAYSLDLRKRVIKAVKSNITKDKAAEVYEVTKQTIYN